MTAFTVATRPTVTPTSFSVHVSSSQVETLLDVYNARFDSFLDRISELVTSIETTQSTLELQLDNERNRLARFELTLNMAGLCIGGSAMVSGFFGMNLVSGLENAIGGFWVATVCSLIFSVFSFVFCTRRFRQGRMQQQSRLQDVQALKRVLTNVDAVALLLRSRPTTDLNRLIEEQGVTMSERELDMLQGILQHRLPGMRSARAQDGPLNPRLA